MTLAYELRRDAHAIGEFSASVQLFQPVGADTFSRVVQQLRREAKMLNLPAAMPIQVLRLNFGPQPFQDVSPQSVGFQRFAETGEIAMSLQCDNNGITFTLREYVSWELIKPTLIKTFSSLLKVYAKEIPAVQSIKVQYLNEFRASSGNILSASDIFSPDSKWVAPFVADTNDDWHCNVGKYISRSREMRQLVNVNCSVVRKAINADEIPRLYANVLIVAGCFYNLPGQSPLIIENKQLRGQLSKVLEISHSLEKKVLAETISNPYLAAMGALHVN